MPRDEEDDVTENEDEISPPPAAASASRKTNGKRPHTATRGIGAPPDDAPKDAAELWDWIVARLTAQGTSPYTVRIGVYQVDPPAAGTGSEFMVGSVMGGNVLGSDTLPPGQALFDYIVNNFHMTRAASRTAVRYSVRFQWATNAQQFKRGEITLPPAAEIAAVRAEQARSRAAEGGETMPPQPTQPPPAGMGAPPAYAPPPPYYAALPYNPYVPPPQQQPTGFGSPEMMFDLMREMFQAVREQRPPVIPPQMQQQAGIAGPPMPVNEEAIVQRVTSSVVSALKQAGVFDQKPAAPVVQTVAAPPATPSSRMEKFGEKLFEAVMGQVEQSFRRSLAGVGKPPPAEEPEEDEPAPGVGAPPQTPEEALPFRVQPVPEATWRDGRKINFASDDDGKISIQGTLASNPIILETAMDTVVGLAGEVKNLIGRVASSASGPLGAKPPSIPAPPPTPAIGPVEQPAPAPPAAVPNWRE